MNKEKNMSADDWHTVFHLGCLALMPLDFGVS